MNEKICLVTGANAGIGKMTALAFARQGARVVLLCRNLAKAEKARDEIRKASGNDRVEILVCDLASQSSIRRAVEEFQGHHGRLDVLVNNAGVFYAQFERSPEGFEMQLAVNHLAYFFLTHLLTEQLKAAPAARIVNVSSGAHYGGQIDFESFDREAAGGYKPWRAYGQSKLANVLFTYELARRLQGTAITANVLHPGVVRTDIGGKHSNWFYRLLWTAMKPFMLTTAQGARTSVFLATSSKVEGLTGKYFENMRERRSSVRSYDQALAKELWRRSTEMCGLQDTL